MALPNLPQLPPQSVPPLDDRAGDPSLPPLLSRTWWLFFNTLTGALGAISTALDGLSADLAAQQNDVQIAYASGLITLAVAVADVPGATLTLARAGRYLITGTFDFGLTGAGDIGQALLGYLMADGVQQSQLAALSAPAAGTGVTASQQWVYVAPGAGKVVKLRGSKTGGTGASWIGNTHTSITALWIGA